MTPIDVHSRPADPEKTPSTQKRGAPQRTHSEGLFLSDAPPFSALLCGSGVSAFPSPRFFCRASEREGFASLRRARSEGFTFLELMFVIILIGILFSFAIPNFEGLTPKYRLRTATRELGVKIESHRLLAITKGVSLGIRYIMEDNETYYQLLQPPPEDYPSQPISERAVYAKEKLPTGVQILGVQIRGDQEFHSSGSILIVFSPTGTSGSHAVTLGTSDGRRWTVELNAITGMVDFRNGEDAGFKDFEG